MTSVNSSNVSSCLSSLFLSLSLSLSLLGYMFCFICDAVKLVSKYLTKIYLQIFAS